MTNRHLLLLRVSDGDLDLDASLDRDRGDLLDDLGRRAQVDDALVDAHLQAVPGLGTLTARRLARGDDQVLGRHAHRALRLGVLLLRLGHQVGAHWDGMVMG